MWLSINTFRHTDLYNPSTAAEISTILTERKKETIWLYTKIFCINNFWLRPPSGLLLILRWDPDFMDSNYGHNNRCFSMTGTWVMQALEEQM